MPSRTPSPVRQRILWIHAGGHKTGSTAIQNYLAFGGLKTTAPHFFYRRVSAAKDPKHVGIGNGQLLFELLEAKENLEKALKEYMSSAGEAIVSSENLSLISLEGWQNLNNAAASQGIRLEVVFFVRDPVQFLTAMYDQFLKEGKVAVGFKEWVVQAEWRHASALRRLAAAFPQERLRVRHYDSEKRQLLSVFFQALGISSPKLSPLVNQIGIVNRSLTPSERDLLLWINQTHPTPFFQACISNGLLNAEPDARTKKVEMSRELSEELQVKFARETDWINHTFFSGQPVVGNQPVVDQDCEVGSPGDQAAQTIAAYRRALGLVLESANIHAQILEDLKKLNWSLMNHQGIPRDFDLVGYLTCNSDLINYQGCILTHYLEHGKQEGRKWK